MTDVPTLATSAEADTLVLKLTVDLDPESGKYYANLHSKHPMSVRAYRLAEVLQPIWAALAADDYFQRWPSNYLINTFYSNMREDNARLSAQNDVLVQTLQRIYMVDHPDAPVETLAQAREIAEASFKEVSQVRRDVLTAAREGAFKQTNARTDRDLLIVLRQTAAALLDILRADAADPAARLAAMDNLDQAITAAAGA